MPMTHHKKTALHIVTRLDKGGLADTVLTLCAGVQSRGYDVTCVTGLTRDPHPAYIACRREGKIPLIVVPELRRAIHPYFDAVALVKLIRLIGALKPTIVHTHSSKAGILGRLAAAYWGVPVRIHSPHGHIFYGYFNRASTQFFIALERLLARCTTRIITLTRLGKKDHVHFKIAPSQKFAVIPCGIQYPVKYPGNGRLNALKHHLGLNGEKVIGWVGRLEPVKGCDIFLEACRLYQQSGSAATKFVVVGDGSQSAALKEVARQLGIADDTIFLGNRTDVPDLMFLFDVFVLSSRNEGLGRVILEAMSCSVPVIATRVGGVPEIIAHNANGLLAPADQPRALAAAMQTLMTCPDMRHAFISNAQNTCRHYHFENMIDRTEQLYSRLAAEDDPGHSCAENQASPRFNFSHIVHHC
ncbi:MAG: glycosyltransferase family 4 protein [Candidatus Zhuqueibacterota bacterium]